MIKRHLYKIWHYSQRFRYPYNLMWDVHYRLPELNRMEPGRTRVADWDIEYVDAQALADMLDLQILRKYNDIYTEKAQPRILDCGANIGISVLRYKQLFPHARITAFEPQTELCQILRNNLSRNGAGDTEIVEAGVWTEKGQMSFLDIHENDSQGCRIMSDQMTNSHVSYAEENVTLINTVWLGDYLNETVDFLKLDIEGAEYAVLESCEHLLANVEQMLVEIHYQVDSPTVIARLFDLLGQVGFNIAFQHIQPSLSIRYKRPPNSMADQFPVIWCWRGSLGV